MPLPAHEHEITIAGEGGDTLEAAGRLLTLTAARPALTSAVIVGSK